MTAVTTAAASVPVQLTLAPAHCRGCDLRTHTPAQVRRWPHLARHAVLQLDEQGLCPVCADAAAARLEAARAALAAQRAALEAAEAAAAREAEEQRAARYAAKLERQRARRASDPTPTEAQRRQWAAEDGRGPRGLTRVYGRGGVVRWVEQ